MCKYCKFSDLPTSFDVVILCLEPNVIWCEYLEKYVDADSDGCPEFK